MKKQLLLASIFVFSASTHSADPNRDIGERYLEEQKKQREIQQLEKKQKDISDEIQSWEIPNEDICFQIDRINLKGNSLLERDELFELISFYKNICLGKLGINQLMERLTALYIDNGYITTRVYIPPQDLTKGDLELIVVEGKLESLSLNNNSEDDIRKLHWAMSPELGAILNITDIEQGIDQINRVQSANAQMKLWPGEETGQTKIQIKNTPNDEVRGHIERSNDGQDSTGKQKIRLGIEIDNWVGINDSFYFNYIGSKDTNAVTANFSYPFRRWTHSFQHSYSEYLNILPENTDLFGQSNTTTYSTDYLLYRSGKLKLKWLSSITQRLSERELLGIQLTPQKQVPIRTALNLSENKAWGFYSAEFGLSGGTKLFGANKDTKSPGKYTPRNQFFKIDGRFTLSKPLTSIFSYLGSAAWQYTDDPLLSSEQIHIGDRNTVRGYETQSISGERGIYIKNDLNISPIHTLALINMHEKLSFVRYISIFLALDTGYAEAIHEDHYKRVTGSGYGLKVNHKYFSGQVTWAKTHSEYSSLDQEAAIYASAQVKIF